jgi:hypothetical protein
MKSDMKPLNPLEYPMWDDMVGRHAAASVFHTSNWARTLADSYGYRPAYFSAFSDSGLKDLIPVMEVRSFLTGCRGVSLPFTDYCEPILSDRGRTAESLDTLIQYGRGNNWRYLELRTEQALPGDIEPSIKYMGHSLSLTRSEEEIFSSFEGSTRRNVKKALRVGLRVDALTSLDAARRFYRLNCMTRRHHGLPPQPYRFFENLHRHVLSQGLGYIVMATHEGREVAGAVFFCCGDKALYKYSASDMRYRDLRGSNLVVWEGIKKCRQEGALNLTLGRTDGDNVGLIKFKEGWGASSYTIPYYRYDFKKGDFVKNKSKVKGLHNTLFRLSPIALSRAVGSLLYRHVG